jgi:hypothetical protein
MDSGESRIDARIKREALLRSGIEDLWVELCDAIETASKKLNEHWDSRLTWKINDGNSVMRVSAPPSAEDRFTRLELEVRFDRGQREVVARLNNEESGTSYRIKADLPDEKLVFGTLSRLALAETLIAEKLLKINLNLDD